MSYFALAALELTLLGLLSGIAGTLIVLRRRSFFAVALSHATFPGGVIFAIAGWNLLLGQALFALVLVLLMTLLARVPEQGRQVTSGVVLSFGFALGTLLAGLNPGLGVPVEALLVGTPLGVSVSDVMATAGVLVAALIVIVLMGRRVLFHTFDPVGYAAAGFKSWHVELVVTGIIAAAVVVAMPAVGAILGVSVLIGPAATARLVAPRLSWIPPLSVLFGVGGGLIGLQLSRTLDIAAGGAVGLVITAIFLIVLLGRGAWRAARRASISSAGGRPATVEATVNTGGA